MKLAADSRKLSDKFRRTHSGTFLPTLYSRFFVHHGLDRATDLCKFCVTVITPKSSLEVTSVLNFILGLTDCTDCTIIEGKLFNG